mgnify:CR=1 FL=1
MGINLQSAPTSQVSLATFAVITILFAACSTPKESAPTANQDTGAAVFDTGTVADSGEDSTAKQDAPAADTDKQDDAQVADTQPSDTAQPDTGAEDSVAPDGGTASADGLGGDSAGADGAGTDAAATDTAATDTAVTNGDVASGDANAAGDANATDAASADSGISQNAGSGCSDGTREGFVDAKKYPKVAACSGAWTVPGVHNVTPSCNQEAGNTGKNAKGTGCNVSDLCAVGWRVCYGKADLLSRNSLGCRDIMENTTEPGFFLARTSSTGAFNCSQDSTKFGSPGTVNDLFGCGNLGCSVAQGKCASSKKSCDPAAVPCDDKSTCKPEVCFPLNVASHDKCKTLRHMTGCSCAYTNPPTNTAVKCTPSSGGCGWCKPVNYWEKKLKKTFPEAWDCGTNGTKEADNVVKKHVELGGVLCCQM